MSIARFNFFEFLFIFLLNFSSKYDIVCTGGIVYENFQHILSIKRAYVEVTGDDKTPMEAIGGGTYAKAIHNCIAWGCEFPGEANNIHGANEKLSIESWKKQVELYIKAIQNLNEIEE